MESPLDSPRHNADSAGTYRRYFELLQEKTTEYKIEARHTYNMDEKGFMTGIGRSRRVFKKSSKGEFRASLQDGNRDWVTLVACICADGGVLPPGVIYSAYGTELELSWVDDLDSNKHSAHIASSPTGWSNNTFGLSWLKQIFNRFTKQKAGRKWRLLIVDGRGSHVTMEFIEYCLDHRILVCILPRNSSHILQPLDAACFKPLSSSYQHNLTTLAHRIQGLRPVQKSDFFSLFWKAWEATFTKETVLRGFEVTGIAPLNPSIVMDKLTQEESDASSNDSNSSECSGAEEDHGKAVAEREAESERLEQQRDAAKAVRVSQRGKRKAARPLGPARRSKRVHGDAAAVAAARASSPAPPPKITSRGRNVKVPAKFN